METRSTYKPWTKMEKIWFAINALWMLFLAFVAPGLLPHWLLFAIAITGGVTMFVFLFLSVLLPRKVEYDSLSEVSLYLAMSGLVTAAFALIAIFTG